VEGCFNPVRRRFERHLPVLDPRVELVIYRVAQESLTNVARHAQVTEVLVSLKRGDSVVLRVLTMAGDSMPDLPRAAACAASVSALIVGSRLR
jgi:two-component system sensor histidine kinase UhpB